MRVWGPTPPVRGRCPEGAEGVGITGPYEKKNGRTGSIHAGGHMGPPLQKIESFLTGARCAPLYTEL